MKIESSDLKFRFELHFFSALHNENKQKFKFKTRPEKLILKLYKRCFSILQPISDLKFRLERDNLRFKLEILLGTGSLSASFRAFFTWYHKWCEGLIRICVKFLPFFKSRTYIIDVEGQSG